MSAFANGGTDVRVAVLTQSTNGKFVDEAAPVTVNSCWIGICLRFVDDPDVPPVNGSKTEIQFYKHDFAAAGGGALAFQYGADMTPTLADAGWNSAFLSPGGSGTDRLITCSRAGGTQSYVYDLGSPNILGPVWTVVGDAFDGQDNTVSDVNTGVVLFGAEYTGAATPPPQMVYVDNVSPYGITVVPQTLHSPCAGDYPLSPNCYPPPPAVPRGPIEPGLYEGNLQEEAHWADPTIQGHEYYLPGRKLWERYDPHTCSVIGDCDPAYADPCDAAGNPRWNYQRPLVGLRTGWRLINLTIPAGTGMPTSGPSMKAKTWTIDDPVASATSTQPSELSTAVEDRTQSIADARLATWLPTVVYATKSGSSHGFTAFKTKDILTKAASTCSPNTVGTGERLTGLAYQSILTHLEMEWNGPPGSLVVPGCNPVAPCSSTLFGTGNHFLVNNHTSLYQTRDLHGAPLWVLAIASGFPASGADPTILTSQLPGCLWGPYAGRAMLVLVDVTSTGDGTSFGTPVLLRVALGSSQGHAFSVRTKTVGADTYAYVGDVTGKILVFDVSGRKLLPQPTRPYVNGQTSPPFLAPILELPLPVDPYDGAPANCIDMEIVGDYLYCA